ncbi:hypothetical protein B0H13DRAFT_1909316 [Mycena leptocephala]|nr:hypothetical protein B0H13DRAFT_1909316 [Mycena leptocephala]
MAIISTTPCTYSRLRPTRVRPMRRARLLKADPLDRWLATADVMLDPDMSLHSTLPEGEVMCELYGLHGTVYRLSMVVYDRHAGRTELLRLGRHQGLPADAASDLALVSATYHWATSAGSIRQGALLGMRRCRRYFYPSTYFPSLQECCTAKDQGLGAGHKFERLLSRAYSGSVSVDVKTGGEVLVAETTDQHANAEEMNMVAETANVSVDEQLDQRLVAEAFVAEAFDVEVMVDPLVTYHVSSAQFRGASPTGSSARSQRNLDLAIYPRGTLKSQGAANLRRFNFESGRIVFT